MLTGGEVLPPGGSLPTAEKRKNISELETNWLTDCQVTITH